MKPTSTFALGFVSGIAFLFMAGTIIAHLFPSMEPRNYEASALSPNETYFASIEIYRNSVSSSAPTSIYRSSELPYRLRAALQIENTGTGEKQRIDMPMYMAETAQLTWSRESELVVEFSEPKLSDERSVMVGDIGVTFRTFP